MIKIKDRPGFFDMCFGFRFKGTNLKDRLCFIITDRSTWWNYNPRVILIRIHRWMFWSKIKEKEREDFALKIKQLYTKEK